MHCTYQSKQCQHSAAIKEDEQRQQTYASEGVVNLGSTSCVLDELALEAFDLECVFFKEAFFVLSGWKTLEEEDCVFSGAGAM